MKNEVVTRENWNRARKSLLDLEKAHTQARAKLAEARRALPWVAIEDNYRFTGPSGSVTLSDLFGEHPQLAVYHLMFGPDWEKPCSGCTQWANAFNSSYPEMAAANASLVAISRAPFTEFAAQQQRLGWHFPWYSSFGDAFNFDFHASSDDLSDSSKKTIGTGEVVGFERGENHGVSVFCKDDSGQIYHAYSTYNRGIEALNGIFGYYDLLPGGRAW